MRILIVGAGSTGGYFGGRLALAGRDVTFLVREGRAAQLRKTGLCIVSPLGNAEFTPRLVSAAAVGGPYDVVIVAVKAYALESALADMAPAVGPHTMILPLLNGMRHVEVIRARFGNGPFVGCVCKCATTLDADGRIVQFSATHEVVYGEMDGSNPNGADSSRMRALDDAMQGVGFDARLSDSMEREMWEKWVTLAALGATTCLLRGHVGEVLAAPGGGATATAILEEVVAAVRVVGVAPRAATVDGLRAQMLNASSKVTTSMYRDLLAGNAVETDQILGDLVARAAEAGVAMPLVRAAHAQLRVYQARRAH